MHIICRHELRRGRVGRARRARHVRQLLSVRQLLFNCFQFFLFAVY
jgi:hypothetical protein